MNQLRRAFKRESIDGYLNKDSQLKRVLTTRDLIALGIGAVIGTGIFILPGIEAATHAGPAVSISFLIAAIFSGMAGMAFAEFSSAMPVAGSAYSYGSVIYGELIGWLLGWSLIVEYFLSVSAISTGFAAYSNNLLDSMGIPLPTYLQMGPARGGVINLLAVLLILVISLIIANGLSLFKKIENTAVYIKIAILLLFIILGSFFVKHSNHVPFYPKEFHFGPLGLGGIFSATSGVIFAFIGFDTIAAHAAEAKNPKKTMSRSILSTVVISAVLYTLFAFVLTGMVNYKRLNVDDAAAFALQVVHQNQFSMVITVGALTSLINIGTLTAFLFISFGIIPLRRRADLQHEGFKMPLYPILPILTGILSFLLILGLPHETLWLYAAWVVVGIIWYFSYGIRHSSLSNK
ncbi:APC family permease [Eupransor demetentiae]|uniref:Amino acid:H+ symporter family (PotE) n=1 Tax=Eupransor demetentiae TaxID=3109584 RepID=A0ABP0ERB3_9LACO|nr:Serine transporter YbeC [Lactobacillaceae bacterium LMG 33000]